MELWDAYFSISHDLRLVNSFRAPALASLVIEKMKDIFFLMSFFLVLRGIGDFQRGCVKWYIIVILISFSLMADNVEHL